MTNETLELITRPEPEEDKSRVRNWTVLVWPDSAPPTWRDYLDEQGIEWVCSPLHDKDKNPDGNPKKPHWHVLLCFSGKKSYTQVVEFTKVLNTTIPQRCHNMKGMVRYFCHLDNPEKETYPVTGIECHGGLDLQEILKPSLSQKALYVSEMIDFIEENDITEYRDILLYAKRERPDDWYLSLLNYCSMNIRYYIASRRHKITHTEEVHERALILANYNFAALHDRVLDLEKENSIYKRKLEELEKKFEE